MLITKNKTLLLSIIAISLFMFLGIIQVSAQNNGDNIPRDRVEAQQNREDKRAESEVRREEKKAEIEVKREEKKAEIEEKRKERIESFFLRIVRRLDSAIARLDKLSSRIDSRIEKFNEKGVDVKEARALLAIARDSIDSARENFNSIDDVSELLDLETQRESFGHMREIMKEVVVSIKEAHRALVDVIVQLKANSKELNNDEENEEESEDEENEQENN